LKFKALLGAWHLASRLPLGEDGICLCTEGVEDDFKHERISGSEHEFRKKQIKSGSIVQ
jgi:hypothetical protein